VLLVHGLLVLRDLGLPVLVEGDILLGEQGDLVRPQEDLLVFNSPDLLQVDGALWSLSVDHPVDVKVLDGAHYCLHSLQRKRLHAHLVASNDSPELGQQDLLVLVAFRAHEAHEEEELRHLGAADGGVSEELGRALLVENLDLLTTALEVLDEPLVHDAVRLGAYVGHVLLLLGLLDRHFLVVLEVLLPDLGVLNQRVDVAHDPLRLGVNLGPERSRVQELVVVLLLLPLPSSGGGGLAAVGHLALVDDVHGLLGNLGGEEVLLLGLLLNDGLSELVVLALLESDLVLHELVDVSDFLPGLGGLVRPDVLGHVARLGRLGHVVRLLSLFHVLHLLLQDSLLLNLLGLVVESLASGVGGLFQGLAVLELSLLPQERDVLLLECVGVLQHLVHLGLGPLLLHRHLLHLRVEFDVVALLRHCILLGGRGPHRGHGSLPLGLLPDWAHFAVNLRLANVGRHGYGRHWARGVSGGVPVQASDHIQDLGLVELDLGVQVLELVLGLHVGELLGGDGGLFVN